MDAWIVVESVSYPNDGIGGDPRLKVEHQVTRFSGGPCKFGSGLQVVGIFDSQFEAKAHVADLAANGVIIYEPPAPIKAGELPDGQKPTLRVFFMLKELHQRGYEQLRLVPGMSGSGMFYRSSITPAMNTSVTHGALALDPHLIAENTSGNGEALFQWADAPQSSIAELARLFIRRYPKIAKLGRAPDPAYASWFETATDFAQRGDFPVAYDAESSGRVIRIDGGSYLPTLGGRGDHLPMPPPGLNPKQHREY